MEVEAGVEVVVAASSGYKGGTGLRLIRLARFSARGVFVAVDGGEYDDGAPSSDEHELKLAPVSASESTTPVGVAGACATAAAESAT